MENNVTNPYVGPRPFERNDEDAARFFGRSQETQEIVSLIFGHPVTLVYAQSGAGKTSLFNTAITSKLEERKFDVIPLTRVGGVIPQGIKLSDIKNLYIFNALSKLDSDSEPKSLLSKTLSAYLKERHRPVDESGDPFPRAIIFDQFEELFTHTPENWREQRNEFFQQVVDAVNADPLLRVVFVIREDFLAELDPYARDLPERLRIRYRLERLGEHAALQAIKDPVATTSRSFSKGVAEELVKQLLVTKTVDASGKMSEIKGQYVEPVQLQVACVTLWFSLKSEVTEIQQNHLKNFNVSDALSEFYTSTIKDTVRETGVREADLRNWFGKTLITPMGTRSTVFRGEDTTGDIDNKAVDFLESRHIIRAEYRAGARWYELTHDRLVESVMSSNGKWFETLSPLQRQAALWDEKNREDSWLLSDQALIEVKVWAGVHKDELTDTEIDFLEACNKQQVDVFAKRDAQRRELEMAQKLADEQTRSAQRIRRAFRVSIVIAGIASLLLVAAVLLGIQSYKNQQTTRIQVLTNASAIELAKGRNEFATMLAYQALKTYGDNHGEVEEALANIVQPMPPRESFQAPFVIPSNPSVYSIAFNPLDGGETFFAGYDDGNIFQLTVADGQPVGNPLTGHTDQVTDLAFSPDGKILASGSWDDTIILWDVKTHQQVDQLASQYGSISSMAFSPDGEILASGGYQSITLWDVASLQQVDQFSGHDSGIYALAFSPDGSILASGGGDGAIILWDVATRQQIAQLTGGTWVNALAFSLDGKILVSGGSGDAIILWDVATHQQIDQLTEYVGYIYALALSPDGKTIVSGGLNGTILWDVATHRKINQPVTDEIYSVNAVAFSADGKTLASGGSASTIILWDVAKGQRIGEPITDIVPENFTPVDNMYFSTGGDILAETNEELLMWDGEGAPQKIGPVPNDILDNPSHHLESTRFTMSVTSPDAKYRAVPSYPNFIRIIEVETGQEVRKLRLGSSVNAVAFSPDGNYIAAGGENIVRVWEVNSGKQIARLTVELEDNSSISSLTFSPDGSRIVVALGNALNTVEVWDVFSEQKIMSISNRQQENLSYTVVNSNRLLTQQQDDQSGIGIDENAQVGNRIADVVYTTDGLFVLYENGFVDHWAIWPSRSELNQYASDICGQCELTPLQRADYGLYTWPMRVQDIAGYLITGLFILYFGLCVWEIRRVVFRGEDHRGENISFSWKKLLSASAQGMLLALAGLLTWFLIGLIETIYYYPLETRAPGVSIAWLLLLVLPLLLWPGGAYTHFTRFQTGKWSRTKRSLIGISAGFLGGVFAGFVGLLVIYFILERDFSSIGTDLFSDIYTVVFLLIVGGAAALMSLFGALLYIFLLHPWSEGRLNRKMIFDRLRSMRFKNIPFKRGIMVTIIAGALLFLALYFEIGSIDPGSDILPVIGLSLIPGVFSLMFYPHKSSYILAVVLGGIGAFLWYQITDSPFLSLWFGLGSGFVLSAIISRILHAKKKI